MVHSATHGHAAFNRFRDVKFAKKKIKKASWLWDFGEARDSGVHAKQQSHTSNGRGANETNCKRFNCIELYLCIHSAIGCRVLGHFRNGNVSSIFC